MKEREKFGSRLGFILVSAGCAIGIGNVWKFPYITGIYGGAAFILMYLVFLVALGLPIMVCEFTVGRGSRMGMGKALDTLEPKGTKWHRMKWISILGSFLLMMFYTMVGGWMLKYAFMEATGTFVGLDGKAVEGVFGDMLTNPGTLTFWAIVAIVISFGACGFGLEKGIEKVTKVMMIALLLLMIALAVNSAFLPRQASSSTLCRTSVKWQRKASATRCLRRCRRRSSRFPSASAPWRSSAAIWTAKSALRAKR